MNKRILVTGGSGFLGTHLIRALLAEGYSVKNIDIRPSKEAETAIADVRDSEKMLQEVRDVDAVFHLASLIEAGESVKFPGKFIDFNINGMLSVLDAMKQNDVKTFIFSSSAAVYGDPVRLPIFEDDRTIPINPYGMTKLAMEGLLSSYVASYGMTGMALRYFNLFGPEERHEPETHAIPRFVDQILHDQEITVWGDGLHERDFIYISDVVDAHLKALLLCEKVPNKYHYFNLSTEKAVKVLDVINLIAQYTGKEANVKHFPDRPGDPRVLVADASKARHQLDWEAKVSLEEGLQKVVADRMAILDA